MLYYTKVRLLNPNDAFGEFILTRRKSKGITQKKIAEALGVTCVYICDIEKGRRNPPNDEYLLILKQILALSEDESNMLYDLAAASKHSVSSDLSEYVMSSDVVRKALRLAKDKATQEDWIRFIKSLS